MGALSFAAQVNMSAHSDLLLTVHGAGAVNCIFQSSGSVFVEIFPTDALTKCYFGALCGASSGIHYLHFCPSGPCAPTYKKFRKLLGKKGYPKTGFEAEGDGAGEFSPNMTRLLPVLQRAYELLTAA